MENMDQGKKLGLRKCGNGVYDAGYEECDDGNTASGDGCLNCVV